MRFNVFVGEVMKRFFLCALCIALLSGCGILPKRSYVVVEPHQEDYQKSPDSDTITVGSYGGLKNAILSLVEDGVKDGVIRAEGYQGNLDEDLSQAVYEVTQVTPLGVFAVEHMTYDYSRIVSYYEIHLNTTFRRSTEELASIVYVTNADAVRENIMEAMERYAPVLILQIGDYEFLDIADVVEEVYKEHPEFALELPGTAVELYPDSGTQRIMEIKFSYDYDSEFLLECQEALQEQMAYISRIYGSAHSDMTNAKRLYKRLGRNAVILEEAQRPLDNSAYGILIEGAATSYGFAQTYLCLLNNCEIEGQLIAGQKNGVQHYWCLVRLDGESYYVDPSVSTQDQDAIFFLLGSQELLEYGYQTFHMPELPEVVLPDYLKPMGLE